MKKDAVNHPPHYTRGAIEVRDFVADQRLNFNRGSAVKYIARAGHKDPSKEIEDLEKAVSCLRHEIARLKHQPTASRSLPQANAAEAGPAGGEAGDLSTYCLGCGAKKRTQLCTCPPAITRAPAVEIGEGES